MASSREYLLMVEESALNTPVASPVYWPTTSANAYYMRLTEGDNFGMYTKPIIERIPYGGGLAINADYVTDHYECKGTLKTLLYPAHAPFLMNWICTRVDGSSHPWATTEPVGDLASISIYHAVQRADGTYKLQQFSGCKPNSGSIEISRDGTVAKLNIEITACRSFGNAFDGTTDPTSETFPAPTDAQLPTGPYTFKMSAGNVTVGSVIVGYETLNINFANVVDGRWFEASYLQVQQFCGRMSKLDAMLRFKSSPDFQSFMEALTAQTMSVALNNGVTGQNMLLTFNSKNYVVDYPYVLPLDKIFTRNLMMENSYDLSAGQDMSVSFS